MRLISLVILVTGLWLAALYADASELVIATSPVDGKQRAAFISQIKKFQATRPDIKVKMNTFGHEDFKLGIERRLNADLAFADVLFWFGGASLRHFADNGWVKDLSDLWQQGGWYNSFSQASQNAISRNGKQYGLPLYYYQWGIYYRKSLFKAYALAVPGTWVELLAVAEKLKAKGITPFALGSKNHWTAAGWFDYVNLRLNGGEFHQQLLKGCVPFTDSRVKKVFDHLKIIVDKQFFPADAKTLDWKGALPYLYRKKSAMLLMGNFFTASVPESIRADIGFFPFPKIDLTLPYYEDAPVDVLVVPQKSTNSVAAAAFLNFMANDRAQGELARSLGMIPTNVRALLADDEQIRQGANLLREAAGVAQFFDRDAPPEFSRKAMPLLSAFLHQAVDSSKIQRELERIRLEVWPDNAGSNCLPR